MINMKIMKTAFNIGASVALASIIGCGKGEPTNSSNNGAFVARQEVTTHTNNTPTSVENTLFYDGMEAILHYNKGCDLYLAVKSLGERGSCPSDLNEAIETALKENKGFLSRVPPKHQRASLRDEVYLRLARLFELQYNLCRYKKDEKGARESYFRLVKSACDGILEEGDQKENLLLLLLGYQDTDGFYEGSFRKYFNDSGENGKKIKRILTSYFVSQELGSFSEGVGYSFSDTAARNGVKILDIKSEKDLYELERAVKGCLGGLSYEERRDLKNILHRVRQSSNPLRNKIRKMAVEQLKLDEGKESPVPLPDKYKPGKGEEATRDYFAFRDFDVGKYR